MRIRTGNRDFQLPGLRSSGAAPLPLDKSCFQLSMIKLAKLPDCKAHVLPYLLWCYG